MQNLPEGSFSKFTKLKILILSNNNITEIPKEIFEFRQLTALGIKNNEIAEIPKEIINLTNLNTFFLEKTNVTKFPTEICTPQSKLTSLWISNNNITTEIPKEIINLKKLKNLRISETEVTVIPEEITQLTELSNLIISHCKVSKIPENIVNLRNLINLTISHCNITEISPNITKELTKLQTLNISNNLIQNIPLELIDNMKSFLVEVVTTGNKHSEANQDKILAALYLKSQSQKANVRDNPQYYTFKNPLRPIQPAFIFSENSLSLQN